MKVLIGFFMAWGNFCIIPCPYKPWDESCRKVMLAALPVIGLAMGGIWYGLAQFLLHVKIYEGITAAVLTIYPFLISGFMHLDGFMDCCDAICSRAPMEKKQEILKDSRVGTFAVAWCIILFMLFFVSMNGWIHNGANLSEILIIIPMISRLVGAEAIMIGKKMEQSQYRSVERSGKKEKIFPLIITVIAIVVYVIAFPEKGLIAPGISLIIGLILVKGASSNLGGMNGDIAGYGITAMELVCVICMGTIF